MAVSKPTAGTKGPGISSIEALIGKEEVQGNDNLHHLQLATQVQHNLQYQHRWTRLKIHRISPLDGKSLPRPLVSGLPPRRLYVHPDEQVELLKKAADGDEEVAAELEWVLPTHLREEWSLSRFAEVFSKISKAPPDEEESEPSKWRSTKRVLMAIASDDSTVVYYFVHDGIVKPRQN
jgi:tRNA-splicing endonuclease subunit Sen15, fungi type